MIENEIEQILLNPKNVDEQLNDLTDEFRGGRNPWELLELFEHNNNEAIEIGLYIINEIIIEDDILNEQLKHKLTKLIKVKDSNIRMSSFLILSQIYTDYSESEKEIDLYKTMIKDNDKHIIETGKKLLKDGHLK